MVVNVNGAFVFMDLSRLINAFDQPRILGITKLTDTNNAGTKQHAKDCTLILTKWDSAKALAILGLGVMGRDNFSVFLLCGKLLNVWEVNHDQILKNKEIQNIKKILGLQHNKDYLNITSLCYGRLMIMTDQVDSTNVYIVIDTYMII